MPSPRLPTQTELSQRTFAVVMAGGNGSRLGDLTRAQCKPALSFGGQYRNIDFPLSNCVNSGIWRIALATQYMAHSLIQHVHKGWPTSRPEVGEFIELWPAQQRGGTRWYSGTADAIYQNLDLIAEHAPDYVLVLAGDHVYKMDYRLMLAEHVAAHADVTIGCVEVPLKSVGAFGILETDEHRWVTRFDEKPVAPPASAAEGGSALASMGIYVFNAACLTECLDRDAADPGSRHDFGRNVLPALVGGGARVLAYPFRDAAAGGAAYWRDVGTVDSYWNANMELLADKPQLDLHDDRWPIWTHHPQCPPPIFTGQGFASRSIVAGGCSIAGTVAQSVLSRRCLVGSGSAVESCVVLPNVTIGRDCRVRRAIVDAGCVIPDGVELGGDVQDKEACRYSVEGIAVITKAVVERAMARAAPPKVAYLRR